MSLIDRIAHSQEHSFIALRTNGLVAVALLGLAMFTVVVFPQIVA